MAPLQPNAVHPNECAEKALERVAGQHILLEERSRQDLHSFAVGGELATAICLELIQQQAGFVQHRRLDVRLQQILGTRATLSRPDALQEPREPIMLLASSEARVVGGVARHALQHQEFRLTAAEHHGQSAPQFTSLVQQIFSVARHEDDGGRLLQRFCCTSRSKDVGDGLEPGIARSTIEADDGKITAPSAAGRDDPFRL